jgi:hypothetical protein
MSYGASKELVAESVVKIPQVGILEGVTLESVVLSEDQTKLEFTFRQPNGALVRHTEFEAKESPYATIDKQEELTNRRVKHIATKFLSEDAFVIPNVDSFATYAAAVIKLLAGKFEGIKVRVLFVYNGKGYVSLPKFPNFIESSDVTKELTKLVIDDYIAKALVKKEHKPDVEPGAVPVAKPEDALPF